MAGSEHQTLTRLNEKKQRKINELNERIKELEDWIKECEEGFDQSEMTSYAEGCREVLNK